MIVINTTRYKEYRNVHGRYITCNQCGSTSQDNVRLWCKACLDDFVLYNQVEGVGEGEDEG